MAQAGIKPDWADTRIVLADGSRIWADEDRQSFLRPRRLSHSSMTGVPSAELLKNWRRSVETKEERGRVVHTVHWTDAKTGLRITALVAMFQRYAAVECCCISRTQGHRTRRSSRTSRRSTSNCGTVLPQTRRPATSSPATCAVKGRSCLWRRRWRPASRSRRSDRRPSLERRVPLLRPPLRR